MSTHPSLEAAWRDLDRRSAILWLLLFGCIPGVFLLAYLLNDLLLRQGLFAVVGLAWMAAIAWAGSRMASFACPRCSGAFFENWIFLKPLRQKCVHCSLNRSAKVLAPEAAGS